MLLTLNKFMTYANVTFSESKSCFDSVSSVLESSDDEFSLHNTVLKQMSSTKDNSL